MNLHNITPPGMYFWIDAEGGRRRSLGTHLWRLGSGLRPEPEPDTESRNVWWVDPHFAWRPYLSSMYDLFRSRQWPRPLCGKRSTSQDVSGGFSYSANGWNVCADCTREATARGIIPVIYRELQTTDPQYTRLDEEQRAWTIAYRARVQAR